MKCINCGRELPPDTAECPFCIEKEQRKNAARNERHKIYVTLAICILVLGLIAAGAFIFMPDTSFQRSLDNAESSYAVAALCEESPAEAAQERYQLRLIDAVNDIEMRYNEQTCGYNQTVSALKQIYSVDNSVLRDHTEEVWSNVERMRFYQLLNHKRSENGLKELEWNADIAAAAEAVADEYAESGLDYQQNAERIVKSMLPETENITFSALLNTLNSQDALVKYEEDSEKMKNNDLLSGEGISIIGTDAVYSEESGLWSFFIITKTI